MDKLKKLIWCFLVILVGMSAPMVFGNYLTNGGFDSDVTEAWTLLNDNIADANMVVEYDAGTAKCYVLPSDLGTDGHHFWQAFPVAEGKMYQLTGKWMGKLNSGELEARATAEVEIGFDIKANADGDTDWDVVYKKAHDTDPEALENLDASGVWGWEEISDSPENDGVDAKVGFEVPEGMTFMFVSFALNTKSGDLVEAGDIEIWLDDIEVKACQDPTGDLDGDCMVTLSDLAIVAADWLKCNLDPQSSCPL